MRGCAYALPITPHRPPPPPPPPHARTHAGSHVLTVQGLLLRNALLPSKQLVDSGRAAPAPLAFNLSSSSSSSSSSNFSNVGAVCLVLLDCTVSTSCDNLAQFAAWVNELPLTSADVQVGLSVRPAVLHAACGSWIPRTPRGSWILRTPCGFWIPMTPIWIRDPNDSIWILDPKDSLWTMLLLCRWMCRWRRYGSRVHR